MMNYENLSKMMLWLSLGLFSLFLINQTSATPYNVSIYFLGILIIIHGTSSFYRHGGDFITPTGVFMLTTVAIGGIPAILMLYESSYFITFGHWIATYTVFIGQVLIYHVFGQEKKSIKKCTKELRSKVMSKELVYWAYLFGFFLIIMGFIISLLNHRFEIFFSPSVYVSMAILLTVLWRRDGGRISFKNVLITLGLFLVYYQFFFGGFGRINIATLLLVFILCANHVSVKKNLKKLIIIGTYPAMIIASLITAGGNSDETRGMGSIYSPHYRFGEIVQLYNEGLLNLFWGRTIWAAIVTPFPRELWENKPWNFNREITFIFNPQYIDDGHSEASVIYAEWFFNFGYLGIILAILSLGLFLKAADYMYLDKVVKFNWTKVDFIKYITLLIITVGIIDLYWGGFSTFMARGGIRLLVMYTILLMFVIYIQRKPKKSSSRYSTSEILE